MSGRFVKPDPAKAARLQRRIKMREIKETRDLKARVEQLEQLEEGVKNV